MQKKLTEAGYYADRRTAAATSIALYCEKPLLLEGPPGAGKTFLATTVAKMLDLPLIRLQMYEGLTPDSILYDYDYQRQLLTLEAVKSKLEKEYEKATVSEMIGKVAKELDFYGPEFMIARPILKAITEDGRYVLLIDEIDKASEEIEYMLYEFLEDYSISIPQYGTIRCDEDKRPIVFMTSNHYRELSDALKRRCNYLYIKNKTKEELVEILRMTTKIDEEFANTIAVFSHNLNEKNNVRKLPSLSELIAWAKYIEESGNRQNIIDESLSFLVKDHRDTNTIKKELKKVL